MEPFKPMGVEVDRLPVATILLDDRQVQARAASGRDGNFNEMARRLNQRQASKEEKAGYSNL